MNTASNRPSTTALRLGGPIYGDTSTPEQWIARLQEKGYRAAYCPVDSKADAATVEAYALAAQRADILIAEVGAWSNPLSPDDTLRRQAIAHCQAQLDLAERIGACCCVNITGGRGEVWDGPHPDNYTPETYEKIVETVREIVDAVQPKRTFYTLETMPWMLPDSVESYARLLRDIHRPACGVHFDPVNLINSPRLYYQHTEMIREFCVQLGASIRSVHLKDIALTPRFMTHLDEVRPGLGGLNYPALLSDLAQFAPHAPLMLEHLPNADEYDQAAAYVRAQAEQAGILL